MVSPQYLARGGTLEILVEVREVCVFFSFVFFWFLVCVWSVFGLCLVQLFCLTRPILPPEMFESGKKLGWTPYYMNETKHVHIM